jgi:hypothetical protein
MPCPAKKVDGTKQLLGIPALKTKKEKKRFWKYFNHDCG